MAKAKQLIFLLVALTVPWAAQARLEVTVTGGAEGALPIAIVPFGFTGKSAPPEDIAAIVGADLSRSGRFAPLPATQLVAKPHDGSQVEFDAWRKAGIDTLLVGSIAQRPGGGFQVQFQLFDVLRGAQLAGYVIPTPDAGLLRRAAHQISDIVYEKLTGERGAFNTHVAYVTAENLGNSKRRFRLAVADADGYNEQVILTSSEPLMSPAWSPDGKQLAYVSFEGGRSMVYVQNVATGQRDKVADFNGINSAPAWAPDGKRLAMTLSKDGNPEIYILNLADRSLTRVTHNYAIDTEPAWLPGGNGLVFTSDRGGRPQLYQVALDAKGDAKGPTGSPHRITFDGSYNARAALSPDGRLVAMVHGTGNNRFQIAVLDLQTGNLNVLTDTGLDESPSFAPNGRMIIYATEIHGHGVLAAASVDGHARQQLGLTSGDVREPAWSPFYSD